MMSGVNKNTIMAVVEFRELIFLLYVFKHHEVSLRYKRNNRKWL